jgi:hypothetical protein
MQDMLNLYSYEDVRQELEQRLYAYHKQLEDWKQNLNNMRQQYYFLNYVPNIVASSLIESIEKNDSQMRQEVI